MLTVTVDQDAVTMSDPVHLTITVTSSSGIAPTGTVFANQSGTAIPFGTQPGEILLGTGTLVPAGGQSSATFPESRRRPHLGSGPALVARCCATGGACRGGAAQVEEVPREG